MTLSLARASLPAWDEAERLAALDRYRILDTPREPAFDDIARLAAEVCDAPYAVVNLIAEGRQWFKAEVGFGVRETPLDSSICAHALLQPGLFVVPDLSRDPRFDCNPLVTGSPGLRAYAGALLETPDSLPLGTLCVLDTRPRDFTDRQGRALTALAGQVVSQLELRRALVEREAEIAQRRLAEEALREREEELARVQRIGRIGGLEVDLREGFRNRRSPEYLRVHGLPPEAAHESHADWVSRIHPDDRERVERDFLDAVRGDARDYAAEYRIIRPCDGEMRWIAARAVIERDAGGRALRLVGAHSDITERRLTESALRESESRFRHMADSVPALIWMTDEAGAIVFANMHYDHVFGRPAATMLGAGWTEIVLQEDLPAFEARFQEAFEARRPFRAEVRVQDREGAVRWLRCEGVARLDDTGAFLGYTGCNVDVTDVKVAQEHQELLINELNHRVKNTLATVQSIASQSLRNAASPADARRRWSGGSSPSRALTTSHPENWESAGIGEIVRQAMEPYMSHGAERFALAGPDVRLAPRVALAVAMALQELATNAVKYGALSTLEAASPCAGLSTGRRPAAPAPALGGIRRSPRGAAPAPGLRLAAHRAQPRPGPRRGGPHRVRPRRRGVHSRGADPLTSPVAR
jgi:PAS domain S-box-containing protein